MAETFKIYKGAAVVKEGASPLSITGVAPNTTVATGAYQVARVIDGVESDKVDIPTFKTLPILPTGVTITPTSTTEVAGTAGTVTLTTNVVPANATNKSVTFTIAPVTTGLTVSAAGKISWTSAVPAGVYTTTVKTTDGNKTNTSVLTLTPP